MKLSPAGSVRPIVANPRTYIIGFFALTTVGLAAVVWTQHLDLIKLRNGGTLADNERADWQKKVLAAEKRIHELEDEIDALHAQADKSPADDVAGAADPATQATPSSDRPRRGPNGRFANFQAVMNDPQFAKLMATQQKGMLDSRYAPLFKQLALTPAQLDQFKNLLLEKQNAARDVLTSARDQGLNPRTDRDAINQLLQQSNAEVDSQIQATLGPEAYSQYQNYQQTLPQRNTVTQLQQSLSYTNTPLTDAQANQLIQIMASAAPQNNNANGNPRALLFGGGGIGGQARVTDAAITQAQGVLSQPQVAALQQLQQQQQAQAEMARMLRNSFQQPNGGSTSSTVTIAPNGTTAVTRTPTPNR